MNAPTRQQAFDLDGYFRRIGYSGKRAPTPDVLRALHALQPRAIAFENLDPLLKRPVLLDGEALQDKMLRAGRGGYCFEQNLLFAHALSAVGFDLRYLTGRVRWNFPAGLIVPRQHMLLLVEIGGTRYLADVGFGGNTLTGPLLLESREEQATPHEPARLVKEDETLVLQTRIGATWKSLYAFDLAQQLLPDLEAASWYASTHPNSHFTTDLVAARVGADCRFALRNNELAVHRGDGGTERRTLQNVAELRDVLTGTFGLTLPAPRDLDTTLAKFIRSGP